jgi:uncharacterized membrane protein YgcG
MPTDALAAPNLVHPQTSTMIRSVVMSFLRSLAIFVSMAAVALVSAAPAQAHDVPRLAGQVTDLTERKVLAGGQGEIDRALTQLQQQHNVQLFVLFTETNGDHSAQVYAEEVAEASSLGDNEGLLVVALRDRTYYVWLHASLEDEVSSSEAERIRTQQIEPRLRAGDYSGAVVAGATGLGEAVAGDVAPGGEPSGEPAPAGGGFNLLPILGLVLVVVGGLWVWGAVSSSRRQRHRQRQTAEERDRRTGELAREANALLIRTDDALRDAQQEIGFAEAQFSEADVAPYREALRQASEELKAAFAVRQ